MGYKKMSGLFLSTICMATIILVPLYSQNSVEEDIIYPEKQLLLDYLNHPSIVKKYGRISDSIWTFAELGMQEFKSSSLLINTLREADFKIKTGLAGIPTCFVASFGSGEPVIGIMAEFDALPGLSQKAKVPFQDPLIEGAPGHGCGHNTMGAAAVASAIAVKKSMKEFNIQGTIKVFGSPAEENLISRPYMVREGLFDSVDVVIDHHSDTGFRTRYGVYGSAMFSTIFTFKGKSAHGGSPWKGRSALDAVEIMNVSTNYLREHLHFGQRIHYAIIDGGSVPNVVPDQASVWYYIRNSDHRIESMYERVINCAIGAALATGTELAEIRCLTAIHQRHANKAVAELFQRNIHLIGMPEWTDEEQVFAKKLQNNLGVEQKGLPHEVDSIESSSGKFTGGGSSDVGDVTLVVPTATIEYPGAVPGRIPHHWSSVACNYGPIAWKGLNSGAKAIAASAIDLLTQKEELAKIKKEFNRYSRKHPYKSFLPDNATPPVNLNKEMMEKWRVPMEKLFLNLK